MSRICVWVGGKVFKDGLFRLLMFLVVCAALHLLTWYSYVMVKKRTAFLNCQNVCRVCVWGV